MYSYGHPHMAEQKQDDLLEHTYSSYVRLWDIALKTCRRRWTIGRSGERGSGISVLATRHDDDEDDDRCKRRSSFTLSNNPLSMITLFSNIWHICRTRSGVTTPGQSGPGSDGNEGVLHIPQSSRIIGTSPLLHLEKTQHKMSPNAIINDVKYVI